MRPKVDYYLFLSVLLLICLKAQFIVKCQTSHHLQFASKFVNLSNNTHYKTLPRTGSSSSSSNNALSSNPITDTQFKGSLYENACTGTSNRFSGQHNKTDHYQILKDRYRNCTTIIGNLEITWLENGRNSKTLDLKFLESIREITGYLLIAYVDVEAIRLPNLQIIRGRETFRLNNNEKEEFAVILIENRLKKLEMPNLREILTGSVGSYGNQNPCHLNTIDWEEILNVGYRVVRSLNSTLPQCPPCDESCQDGCWGEGPDLCQKFSKKNCASQCDGGRCFGSAPRECCHLLCAGGCTGPKQTDCLACKMFSNEGECVQECPPMQQYNPTKFLWESNRNGKYAFGAKCVKNCPDHLLRDNGACVRTCPPNKRTLDGECVPCNGPCPKNCQGVEIVNSGNIDQFVNCTVIEGSISILDSTFDGYRDITNNTQFGTRYERMDPSRLEALNSIREITGFLNIQANHNRFRNLNFLRNLRLIGGRQTTDMFYSLSIVKTSLISLNLRSLKQVRSGRIIIEDNHELCFADTIDWMQINVTQSRDDITTRNNAPGERCRQRKLQCHEQCARDGCWGPGPDECLSCNNFKLDDYCVDNCTSTQSLQPVGFLSYDAGGRTCKKCHQECKSGCSDTEARHCWQCKNVKDGPYCVAECPHQKYNNNGTCEECDKSCVNGCTGPSNRLGEGGCNSCAKAVITQTDSIFSAHCIRPSDSCPEGYYQEYVSPNAKGPLKSLSGEPVCRKCHHRCKSCTGMGTHSSVCECAKYVAGEQCEDNCPRDYFADEQHRRCLRCSSECNGCFGPTEADCLSCRVYRLYHDSPDEMSGRLLGEISPQKRPRFNCTTRCPPEKPHRRSSKDNTTLDPYCSDDPGVDMQSSRISISSPSTIIFGIIIIAALGVFSLIYKCQIDKDKTVKLTMHLSGIDDDEPLYPSNLKPNLAPLRSIKETELRRGSILGSGFGGTVYQGIWKPEGSKGSSGPRPVAIKVLRDNGQSNMNKEFLDEAYIMASVNHPNLVRLLAVCMTANHLMLVTQLMPLGCLLDYVKKHKNDIGSKNLLEWCKQIARGMAYLEERRMVHRDLALRNVLLQTSGRAMISDFGLAKFLDVDQSEYHSGGGRLPIKWLAPECIEERKFTHESDVWAFGVTVWELVNFGARPFEDIKTEEVPMKIKHGERLPQHNVTAEVYKVMLSCWFPKPEDRPNFKSLVQSFKYFARDPKRYLICGSNDTEFELRRSNELVNRSTSSENDDEFGSDINSFNEDQEINSAQMFGFDNQQEACQQHLSSSSSFKKVRQPAIDEDDVFAESHQKHLMDLNNNNQMEQSNMNSSWSMHHTVSTTSIGQKSEIPTDNDDYLVPSPRTIERGQSMTTFLHPIVPPYEVGRRPYQRPGNLILSRIRPSSAAIRQPPHSAGLVNNYEYFMNFNRSGNLEEEENFTNGESAVQPGRSTSSDNIPFSLV